DDFARRLTDAVSRAAAMLSSLNTFVFEPGRALVQPAMALVTQLLEVRRSTSGVREAVVDASIADLPLADVYPHRILTFDAERRRGRGLGHGDGRLLGRLCMEDDVVATNLALPETARAGDRLVICDAGAYDRSMSYDFGKG